MNIRKWYWARVIGLSAGLGFLAPAASASSISVQNGNSSGLGDSIAQEVSKEITLKSNMTLVNDEDEGWKIVILASPFEGTAFYSAVLIKKRFEEVFDDYIFSFNGACKIDKVHDCAIEIIERASEPISRFERDWQEF